MLPGFPRGRQLRVLAALLAALLGPGPPALAALAFTDAALDDVDMVRLAWDSAEGACWDAMQTMLWNAGVYAAPLEEEWTDPQLAAAHVLWVDEPDLGSGLVLSPRGISPEELERAMRFVAEGGSLVVTGGAGGRVMLANHLLAAVGATVYLAGDTVTPLEPCCGDEAPWIKAEVNTPQGRDGLQPLLLSEAGSVHATECDATVLLKGPDQVALGALERVGKGYVAAFGGPLLAACPGRPGFDNHPFVAALAGWLGQRTKETRAGR